MTQGAGGGRPQEWAERPTLITIYIPGWFHEYLRDISGESASKGLFQLIRKVHSMGSTVLQNSIHSKEFYDERIIEQENLIKNRKTKEVKVLTDKKSWISKYYTQLTQKKKFIDSFQIYADLLKGKKADDFKMVTQSDGERFPVSKKTDTALEDVERFKQEIESFAISNGTKIIFEGKKELCNLVITLGLW